MKRNAIASFLFCLITLLFSWQVPVVNAQSPGDTVVCCPAGPNSVTQLIRRDNCLSQGGIPGEPCANNQQVGPCCIGGQTSQQTQAACFSQNGTVGACQNTEPLPGVVDPNEPVVSFYTLNAGCTLLGSNQTDHTCTQATHPTVCSNSYSQYCCRNTAACSAATSVTPNCSASTSYSEDCSNAPSGNRTRCTLSDYDFAISCCQNNNSCSQLRQLITGATPEDFEPPTQDPINNNPSMSQGTGALDEFNPLLISGSNQAQQLSTPGGIISRILVFAFPIAGIIMFVIITIGGFQVILTSATKKTVEEGKKKITTAVLGFVLLFASYWIIQIIQVISGARLF